MHFSLRLPASGQLFVSIGRDHAAWVRMRQADETAERHSFSAERNGCGCDGNSEDCSCYSRGANPFLGNSEDIRKMDQR